MSCSSGVCLEVNCHCIASGGKVALHVLATQAVSVQCGGGHAVSVMHVNVINALSIHLGFKIEQSEL